METRKIGLIWFKNDLRMHDNASLANAANECDVVLPLFIIDPRWSASTVYGFKKTGAFRMQFIYECVLALQQKMRESGSDLMIAEGLPEEIIPALILKHQITDVYTKQEFGCDEKSMLGKIKNVCKIFRVNIHTQNTQTLLNHEAIDKTTMPGKFADFVASIKVDMPLRTLANSFEIKQTIAFDSSTTVSAFDKYMPSKSMDERTVFPFQGGEDQALQRLKTYIWSNALPDQLESYQTQSALAYSSKFSPWLAQGCLSVAFIYQEIKAYQTANPDSTACDVFLMDLLWREFFYLTFDKYGVKFFRQGGVHNKALVCIKDYEALSAWIQAQTEDDYINANMMELAKTGWLSASGRKHVVNYLSKQMLVDWRIGGAYFESQLLDYDVCLNYGNWAYMVGVGPDIDKNFEKFPYDIIKQTFDNNGNYRKKWLEHSL
jgi:deoxyribodipyrimidine photo-lyase